MPHALPGQSKNFRWAEDQERMRVASSMSTPFSAIPPTLWTCYVSLRTCPCAKNMRKVCESVEESTRERFCYWSKPVSFCELLNWWICRFGALFWFLFLVVLCVFKEDSSTPLSPSLSLSFFLFATERVNIVIYCLHFSQWLIHIYHIFYSKFICLSICIFDFQLKIANIWPLWPLANDQQKGEKINGNSEMKNHLKNNFYNFRNGLKI